MIKHILQLTIMSIVLYYSFIDVVPVFYWVLTGAYIFVGVVACIFAYGLDTKASWIQPKEVYKLQAKLDRTKIVFSTINIVIITLVVIYTGNYYHLLYPLTLVGLWSSIHNYQK